MQEITGFRNGHFFGIIGTVNSSDFISTALWNTIHIEVLRQCDELDGVADGIIEDPSLCSKYLPLYIFRVSTELTASS